MSKVKSVFNKSNVTVAIKTSESVTHLPPRATLSNVDILNLDEVKKTCSVSENLNEVSKSAGKKKLNG